MVPVQDLNDLAEARRRQKLLERLPDAVASVGDDHDMVGHVDALLVERHVHKAHPLLLGAVVGKDPPVQNLPTLLVARRGEIRGHRGLAPGATMMLASHHQLPVPLLQYVLQHHHTQPADSAHNSHHHGRQGHRPERLDPDFLHDPDDRSGHNALATNRLAVGYGHLGTS